ncbi:hypothetical protein KKB10_06310 [Patescibacteria group bacterium]|nr:hypothetical protein [Patescibacteria group bacterium]MBU1075232.1 hypothetical protein [Patescibacteria group bacterium]MBU1951632.1 hypothetical protein [Patescibacteria group bacterium]
MKRLYISIIALVAIVIAFASGCSIYTYTVENPDSGKRIYVGTYERSREPKLLAHRYQGMYYNITVRDSTDKKDPFKLRAVENSFRVQVGHPEKFIGQVISVEVWLDNQGPIQAVKHGDGYFYFTVRTDARGSLGHKNRFGGLSPGQHLITVRIAWEHTRGPYYGGPTEEDYVTTMIGWIDFDPFYVR